MAKLFPAALRQAVAIVSVENNSLTEEVVAIVKQVIENDLTTAEMVELMESQLR